MSINSRWIAAVIASAVVLTFTLAFTFGADVNGAQSCSSSQHREFDFIAGNWLVSDQSGRVTGTVTVTTEYAGCALIEKWSGIGQAHEALGVIGYHVETKLWHRDFIDGDGFVLALDGHRDGKRMVMTGKDYRDPDAPRLHRVAWSPRDDGTIEQLWQTSNDDGRSWRPYHYAVLRRISE